MLAEKSKKRLFKDELEDTPLPGKAITEPLSEVEYLGTSKTIKNVLSASLSVIFQTCGALVVFPKSKISFHMTVEYFVLSSKEKAGVFLVRPEKFGGTQFVLSMTFPPLFTEEGQTK